MTPSHCPPCPLACYPPPLTSVGWNLNGSNTPLPPNISSLVCHQHVVCGKSVRLWCDGSEDRSFMVDPLIYFSFQPVLHDWCHKGRGMCYPVCGMMHIKEPLVLIGKSSLYGGSRFPLSLSEWSFTIICLTPYNRK